MEIAFWSLSSVAVAVIGGCLLRAIYLSELVCAFATCAHIQLPLNLSIWLFIGALFLSVNLTLPLFRNTVCQEVIDANWLHRHFGQSVSGYGCYVCLELTEAIIEQVYAE